VHVVAVVALERGELPAARALVDAALTYDRAGVVLEEKLFGADGSGRTGMALAAHHAGALVGLIASAGRYLKLLAVAPAARRRGVASALVDAVQARTPDARLRVGDQPGNYLTPGLDARYEEARAFFATRGFAVCGETENLRAPLDDNPRVTPARAAEAASRARDAGYQIARGDTVERAPLLDWIGRAFAPVWAQEAARALDGPRRALHVALQHNVPVAFAAADGNNQGLGWFGPAGTDPAHRGRGLGEALLLACLEDVRGLPEAGVIAWIGPKAFYARAVGAVSDRRFLQMERKP
jgi:GNAT superfamily N-acetyltransferase